MIFFFLFFVSFRWMEWGFFARQFSRDLVSSYVVPIIYISDLVYPCIGIYEEDGEVFH